MRGSITGARSMNWAMKMMHRVSLGRFAPFQISELVRIFNRVSAGCAYVGRIFFFFNICELFCTQYNICCYVVSHKCCHDIFVAWIFTRNILSTSQVATQQRDLSVSIILFKRCARHLFFFYLRDHTFVGLSNNNK